MAYRTHSAQEVLSPDFPFRIYKKQGRNRWGEHGHDFIQLWYITNGRFLHYFNGREYTLERGSVFVLPPYVTHGALALEDDCELIGVEFTENFICDEGADERSRMLNYSYLQPFIVSADDIKPSFSLAVSVSLSMEALFEETFFEFERQLPYYRLIVKANLLKILAVLSREYASRIDVSKHQITGQHRLCVQRVLRYVEESFHRRITHEELRGITYLSTSYFSYIFRLVTGMTLGEYITRVRINHAMDLLIKTDLPVSVVAYEAGFGSTTVLDRVFKEKLGLSPLRYRKENKIG